MNYTPKQYRRLSSKKKRQLKLGSNDVSMSDIRSWQEQQKQKKEFSSVYRRYSGGYR